MIEKDTFELSDQEKAQQQAMNSIEALAIEQVQRSNHMLQQVSEVMRVLRHCLVMDIARRIGAETRELEQYDVDENGKATRRAQPQPDDPKMACMPAPPAEPGA